MTPSRSFTRRPRAKCHPGADEGHDLAVYRHGVHQAPKVIPFGSVIGPLAVWLTRRHRAPFIDQAGREALNFGISIAVYGSLLLVAALMLIGIPLLVVGTSHGPAHR